MNKVLLYLNKIHEGNFNRIYRSLEMQEKIESIETYDQLTKKYDFISIASSNYLSPLKFAKEPPFMIFHQGDINLITDNQRTIAIEADDELTKDSYKNIIELVKTCKSQEITPFISPDTILNRLIIELLAVNEIPLAMISVKGIDDLNKKYPELVEKVLKSKGVVLSQAVNTPTRNLKELEAQSLDFKANMVNGMFMLPFTKDNQIKMLDKAAFYASNLIKIMSYKGHEKNSADLKDFKEINLIEDTSEGIKYLDFDYNDENLEFYVKDGQCLAVKYYNEFKNRDLKIEEITKEQDYSINTELGIE